VPETEVNARCDGVVVPNDTEQIPSSRRSLSSVDKTYEYSTSASGASLVNECPRIENRETTQKVAIMHAARCPPYPLQAVKRPERVGSSLKGMRRPLWVVCSLFATLEPF
jgi:hypothetical protein